MHGSSQHILILAPVGRDAQVASTILREVGISSMTVPDLDGLVTYLKTAECAILTEEALLQANRQRLADWIQRQPPWSDYPFVLLAQRAFPPDPRLPQLLANVTVLERPFHPDVLINAVRSALRARKRQREVESHLRERERVHERQSLLIRELHHRVKNTLSTVQALLGATARSSQSIEGFYKSFADRIVALAHTHALLTEDYWQTASLRDMLLAELGPFKTDSEDRFVLDGPEVHLTADLAVPLGMAIHELCTNAAKYGSLSRPEGRVVAQWEIRERDGARNLRFAWREEGGPPVVKPRSAGFGSTLIERVLTTQCKAIICYEFEPSGVCLELEAPLIVARLVPSYEIA